MMENRKNKLMIHIEENWKKDFPEIKDREIKLKVETDLINDIIGPRRAGKTSLLFDTIKTLSKKVDRKSIIYINFENRKLFPLNKEYLNDLIEIIYAENLLKKNKKIYVFLDEIQKIKDWEQYIRSIYDEFKGQIKIFVSGSTSKLTKSKISYLLTGRHLTTFVFPLNFREFLQFNDFDIPKFIGEREESIIKKYLKEYLSEGSFPETVLSNDKDLIETLILDIINRDIIPRVKNKEIIEELVYFLCSNSAKLTSFSKLSRILKNKGTNISVPTLEKYFWIMKESFLFFDTQILSYKIKDQLQYPRKIYCIDNGFIDYFGFKFSEDKGRMMENCVAINLFRKCAESKIMKIFYWKSKLQEEVDFVVKEALRIKELIQVCYDISDIDAKKREVKSLLKASKELKCKNLLVITYNYENEEKIEGRKIKFVPLWKWLLEK